MHGAVSRVGPSDTAFAHRRHPFNFLVLSSWAERPRPSGTSRGRANAGTPCVRSWYPGAYVNYLEEEADPRARAAYGDNYDRLVALKNKYDPGNLFRINHNIRPLS